MGVPWEDLGMAHTKPLASETSETLGARGTHFACFSVYLVGRELSRVNQRTVLQ